MALHRDHRSYSEIAELTGLRRGQISGLVERNQLLGGRPRGGAPRTRSAAAARATSPAPGRRWHVTQAQSNAEQRIREENGQALLPWAMAPWRAVAGMRFKTCQWFDGQPSPDDAKKLKGAAMLIKKINELGPGFVAKFRISKNSIYLFQ